ncbi:MAG: hypothetical protein GY811_18780 [Myxococcales bacterium]|nr:hypothetical protein [Myxococcales bacterium]
MPTPTASAAPEPFNIPARRLREFRARHRTLQSFTRIEFEPPTVDAWPRSDAGLPDAGLAENQAFDEYGVGGCGCCGRLPMDAPKCISRAKLRRLRAADRVQARRPVCAGTCFQSTQSYPWSNS